ncbi:hypothetical protein A4X09_0g7390, partial [Tilletia walkeri]
AAVPRDRADSDSDGKTQDAERLGVRQERTITARAVKAHSPLTGAARRRSKTPTATVRTGKQDEGTIRSRRRTAGQTCNRTGTAQTVRRGGKTAFSYLGDNVKLVREGKESRRQYEGSVRRDQGPLATETASAGASGLRLVRLGRDKTDIDQPRAGANQARSARSRRGRSQCVNTRILRSQGARRVRLDATDLIFLSFLQGLKMQGAGLTAARSARQSIRPARSGRRHGEHVRPNGLLGRQGTGRLGQGHGRMAPKLRWFKTRRTPGTAQRVRRGGETTAGDLTAAKAKPPQTENGGRRYEGQSKGRSARNQVRDVLETAWPVRRDEDAVQLSGRTQRYKGMTEQGELGQIYSSTDLLFFSLLQNLKVTGKARETTVAAQRAGAARRSTTRSGTGRWQLRRPSVAASRRGIENGKTNVNRPKDLKVTGTGLSDSEGKAQDDSVKDTGGRHLMSGTSTPAGQRGRRRRPVEAARRRPEIPRRKPSWYEKRSKKDFDTKDRCGGPRSATHRGNLG